MHPAKRVDEKPAIRPQPHSLLDQLNRLIKMAPGLGPPIAKIIQRERIIRVALQSGFEASFGLRVFIEPFMRNRQIAV